MAVIKEYSEQKALFKAAKEKRLPHESSIMEAFDFGKSGQRFRASNETQYQESSPKHTSTIIRTGRNLITNTMRLLLNQNSQWTEIGLRTQQWKDEHGGKLVDQLKYANDTLLSHFNNSNFYLATTEGLYSNVFAGTMCIMFVDMPDRPEIPLNYISVPIDELFFLEDYNGMVDTVFREHSMSARQIVSRWGEENVHKDILEAIEDDDPTKSFNLKECVIPSGGKFELSYFFDKWEKLTDEETLPLNPFVVSRWEKTLGNVWGNSPVRDALPNARAEDAIVRDTLKYGAYAANGLWQTQDETINLDVISGKLEPGSAIYMEEPLQIVPFPGSFNLNFDMAELQARQIGHLMFDSTPPSEDNLKYMTAEAVIALRQEFFNQVGEPALRLSREYLKVIGEQAFKRLLRRGELDILSVDDVRALEIPGVNKVEDLLHVNINAAITRALESQQAQETLNSVQAVAQVFGPQEIGINVNTEETIPKVLTALGLPADKLRTNAEKKKIQEDIQQQNQLTDIVQGLGGGGGAPQLPV